MSVIEMGGARCEIKEPEVDCQQDGASTTEEFGSRRQNRLVDIILHSTSVVKRRLRKDVSSASALSN